MVCQGFCSGWCLPGLIDYSMEFDIYFCCITQDAKYPLFCLHPFLRMSF